MIFEYSIAIAGAFLAGCINTLSGNGSAITLTILMELLGLPADVANGTNRVGVLTQSLASTAAFRRGGRFDQPPAQLREMWKIIGLMTVGAVVGVVISLSISNEAFRAVFRYLLIVMLVLILVRPKRWLREMDTDRPPLSNWVAVPLFFALGIYGGFIQMGLGVFFLAIMVLVARYDLIQANVVKIAAVTFYTAIVLAIFVWRGLVDWEFGLLMAVGQTLGGYLTARFAASHPQAGVWTYRLLVVVVIAAIAKAFFL